MHINLDVLLFIFMLVLGVSCSHQIFQSHTDEQTPFQWNHYVGSPFLETKFSRHSQKILDKKITDSIRMQEKDSELEIKQIKVKNEDEAEKFIQERKVYLHRLFQTQVDPYWGTPDTGSGACAKQSFLTIPIVKTAHSYFIYFNLYTNENKVIGTCVNQIEKTKLRMQIVFCKEHMVVYDVRYYSPRSQDDSDNIELGGCA